MIEIAIGAIFVFLLLSLVASVVNEALLSLINRRGKELLRGIQTLLNDGDAKKLKVSKNGLVAAVYNHGYIFGLFQGDFDPKNKAHDLPSYIPARNFALALLDVIAKKAAIVRLKAEIKQLPASDQAGLLAIIDPPGSTVPSEGITDTVRKLRDAALQLQPPPQNVIDIANVALGEKLSPPLAKALDELKTAANAIPHRAGAALAAMTAAANPANVHDLLNKMGDAAQKLASAAPQLMLLVDTAKSEANPIPALRRAALLIDAKVGQPLIAMISTASGDVSKLVDEIEGWYNSSMDRVSGWYKYHTQKWLFGIGLVLAVALNANTITILQRLYKDSTLRQSVIAAAQQYANKEAATASQPGVSTGGSSGKSDASSRSSSGNETNAGRTDTPVNQAQPGSDRDLSREIQEVHDQVNNLSGLGLPLGWSQSPPPPLRPPSAELSGWLLAWLHLLLGLVMTAFGVSLGAPFWFDTLNKFMVVRSTVKPREKSQEEGPKD
jgi:hypothetical protein